MVLLIRRICLHCCLLMPLAAAADEADRAAYRAALTSLNSGRAGEFHALRTRLDAYVLAPYLDYYELSRRLERIREDEFRTFRAAHGDLPVTRLLYRRWLAQLGAGADWVQLARNAPDEPDAELQCQYLHARVAVGDAAALVEVAPLWTVGHSQPHACDALFDRWIASGYLTPALAWDRLTLAIENDQTALAHYLLRHLDGDRLRWGQLLCDVHAIPETVLVSDRFLPDGPESRMALSHGLRRLAAGNPDLARDQWTAYRANHAFSPEQSTSIAAAILLAEGKLGRLNEPWPTELASTPPAGLAQTLAQAAVNRQQWEAARYWITLLPPEVAAETRWRYWSARALGQTSDTGHESSALFTALAGERDYYGFLAAERVGLPPRLNAASHLFDPAIDRSVRALPAVQRALELYAVGDLLNARREWHALMPRLGPAEQIHAAYIAQQSGWIPQTIQIANAAMLRDYVDLRFPVVYPDLFSAVSRRTAVAQPFLLAIARQESLFDTSARSAADARGVMQLLPATAIHVARLSRLAPPRVQQLQEPAVNIDLGGRYLAQLLARYGNQRPLAAAAYNAGPGRVDRWIQDRAGEPVDIWIENIPFGETRNYVKNVMAFTQVYGQLLDTPLPMLAPNATVDPQPDS